MLGTAPRMATLAILLLLGTTLSAPATAGAQEDVLLVTYRAGSAGDDVARRAGASLHGDLPHAGVALVAATPRAASALARDPDVLSVERDARILLAGVTWDGITWDGTTWDGATWDGTSWDGATWDGATWDGATWDGATWDGATWDSTGWDGATRDGTSWDGAATGAPALPPAWGLLAIRAPDAWELGLRPHARKVCLVDSGVDPTHPALAGNLGAAWNAIAPGAPAADEAGHGTHLAGIVAAARGWAVPGVAAPLVLSAKAIDATGAGRTSDALRGMAWCAEQGAHVVLLAFTEDAPTRAFRAGVAALQKQGILVVASAGNGGCERCVSAPASLPGVVGVGAFGPDLRRAAFSSDGPEVDLLAPGVAIGSTFPGGGLRAGSGTSQAAAFVAGAAALLWSHEPDWKAEHVAARLERTAEDGRLDLAAALTGGERR